MYQTIYVPMDNSDHSNVAAELGLGLAKSLGAKVVGSHAYAAALHDVRFKQMEFTLPDEYKDETELEKQRRIHDSLITRGLVLISDSYLERWQKRAAELEVRFEGKHFDGKNFQVIVEDIEASQYDLVVLGALGQGAVRDSQVGSVCERVLRRINVDAWVVRDLDSAEDVGSIVVCVDGSPHSLGALRAGCELAKRYAARGADQGDRPVDIVAVEAAGDSEPRQQARAQALDAAWRYAREQGVSASMTRLAGTPARSILEYAVRLKPWLVVAGRLGADADEYTDIGSTAERLLRHAPCNVFLSSRTMQL